MVEEIIWTYNISLFTGNETQKVAFVEKHIAPYFDDVKKINNSFKNGPIKTKKWYEIPHNGNKQICSLKCTYKLLWQTDSTKIMSPPEGARYNSVNCNDDNSYTETKWSNILVKQTHSLPIKCAHILISFAWKHRFLC